MPQWQIGVDVGGTFTDILAVDPATGVYRVAKVPSTTDDQSRGVIEGLARVGGGRRAGEVGRADGQRAGALEDLEGQLVVGHPHRHRAPGVAEVPHQGGLLPADQGQRAGPEGDDELTVIASPTSAVEGGASLSLDPVARGFAVGEHVRLRVEVAAPEGDAPACAPDDDRCPAASCVAATSCPRRATWSLEYR